MRFLVLGLTLATVGWPAAAQLPDAHTQMQLDSLRMQQEAAQRRAIDLANQLEAQAARQRADQAALDLQLRRGDVGPRRAPALGYAPPARSAPTALSAYPSMPDAALADSNRKVRDAARNRR